MKSWNGLTLAFLAFLSNDATQTLAQYVTTVTISINDNPFCTPVSGIGASGISAGGASGSGFSGANSGPTGSAGPGTGWGVSNGLGQSTASATGGSPSATAIDTPSGNFTSLGYYLAPADGDLLGGPVFTSPLMTLELCGTDCKGYTYLALLNGDECNCGSTAPTGPSSSSPPSKNRKRQNTGGDCIPCAGDNSECCGAPGGYALVYQRTPDVEGSSAVVYGSTNSAGSVIKASTTSYLPISSGSVVSYTFTDSDGSTFVESFTSYAAVPSASIYVYNTTSSGIPVIAGTSTSYPPAFPSSSVSTFMYSTTNSAGSSTAATSTYVPSAPATTASSSSNSSNFGTGSTSFGFSSGTGYGTGSGLRGSSTGFSGTVFSGSVVSTGTIFGSNYTFHNPVAASTTATQGGSDGATPQANKGTATVADRATGTNNGGAEPTVNSPVPSCVRWANYAGNNTKFNDYFGYTYDVRCNLNLQSTPADHDAHADSFEDCLEYCSLLTGCIAVTYQDPPSIPNSLSNCYPKWDFGGYTASTADGLYSAVNVNGASDGTLEDQNLCTRDNFQGESYDGDAYLDDYGSAWTIGCDSTLAIPSGAALASTITDTLASCVDYCSTYDSCEAVSWNGQHTNGTGHTANCFPASAAGAAGSASGSGYATLNPP